MASVDSGEVTSSSFIIDLILDDKQELVRMRIFNDVEKSYSH